MPTDLIDMEEVVNFRVFRSVRDRVHRAVKVDGERFASESHFYRVAVLRLLKEVEKQ